MTTTLGKVPTGAPSIPEVTRIATTAPVFRALLASVLPAASHDATRAHICGVMLRVKDGAVTAVATNGHWMAVAVARPKHDAHVNGPDVSVFLRPEEAKRLLATFSPARAKDNWGVLLEVTAEAVNVSGFAVSARVTLPRHDAEGFPAWEQVVPKPELRGALLASTGFNPKYLATAFDAGRAAFPRKAYGSPWLTMAGTGDDLSPCVITAGPHGLVEWFAVVCPVRT
jgi:hypothetical protein